MCIISTLFGSISPLGTVDKTEVSEKLSNVTMITETEMVKPAPEPSLAP